MGEFLWHTVMEYEFKRLFNRLNKTCRDVYNSALQICQVKKHYSLEIEDLLLRLLDRADTDVYQILRHYELDRQSLIRQLESTIAAKKRAPDAVPMVSPQIYELFAQSWLISSLLLNEGQIRSGAMILALVNNDAFRGLLLEKCTLFLRIPRQILLNELGDIIRSSEEKCLVPPHLQLITSADVKPDEPLKQHENHSAEYTPKVFQPRPDEVAAEDYKELYQGIQEINNQASRSNILLIDSPDIEFNSFLAGLSHYINLNRPSACEVKLLRLATEPKYRRDRILLDHARHAADRSKACLYATDTVDFSDNVFEQLQNICGNNKVRFIFHDTLSHVNDLPGLQKNLTVILHEFENQPIIKKKFLNKLKRYESCHNLNLDQQAQHWLYNIANQYAKGCIWSVGERLLQQLTVPKNNKTNEQLSLYPTALQDSNSLPKKDVNKDDIFIAARNSLNKFIDFKSLSNLDSSHYQDSNLHNKLAKKLLEYVNNHEKSFQPILGFLTGGEHYDRFYNAQKAAAFLSLGQQRLVIIAQDDNYEKCCQSIVETLLRYKNPNLFIDFDTISPEVLIKLLQDIEAGYLTYEGMNFSLRKTSFYFSTAEQFTNEKEHKDDVPGRSITSITQLVKQYAGPWIKQHISEYNFSGQEAESAATESAA